MRKRIFLGFRFFGGRSTTWGNSGCIAGKLVGFFTKEKLNKWINDQDRGLPCGCGGGERIAVTRKEAESLCGGRAQFESDRELIENKLNETPWTQEDEDRVRARVEKGRKALEACLKAGGDPSEAYKYY